MDVGSESDPFVKIILQDENGKKKISFKTPSKEDAKNPTWHCFMSFTNVTPTDRLYIKLYDDDVTTREFIASITLEIDQLDYSPKDFTMKKDCHITLRRVHPPKTNVRDVFFIRHGESLWNLAQSKKNYGDMAAYDHPLSEDGIKQALKLNEIWKSEKNTSPLAEKFLESDLIFASPLTRASQTAILGLKGHPHLEKNHKIILLSSCREVKGLGGLDTVGAAFGDKIEVRVRHKMGNYANAEIENIHFDSYDCDATWWTVATSESKSDIDHRFNDFCATLKYSDNKNATIVVGHSLFIKDFCTRYLSREVIGSKKTLTESLQNMRLSNAGCLYARVDLTDHLNPKIIDVDTLFQTTFVK